MDFAFSRFVVEAMLDDSTQAASWSPRTGMVLHRWTKEGRFVRKRSRVVSPLVG